MPLDLACWLNETRRFSWLPNQVREGATVSLSGLTVSNGNSIGLGGGIVNQGTLALTDCTVRGKQPAAASSTSAR